MYRFFVKEDQIHDGSVWIVGEDVNHIKNVLRMKTGDKIFISCENNLEYECELKELGEKQIEAEIFDVHGMETELPAEIILYQALPKGDKMEFIIQKAVELGVSKIVPVRMKRCVVKLDEKKADKKVKRWNLIALSAAKQSKRGIIPKVSKVLDYTQVLKEAENLDLLLVPYEEERGIAYSRELIKKVPGKKSIGIMIGPEGGFEKTEIEAAKQVGGRTLTLGKRILRTETAGMTMLSILMFTLEEA